MTWRGLLIAIGLTLLSIVAGGGAYWMISEGNRQQVAAEQQAEQQTNGTDVAIESSCRPFTAEEHQRCVEQKQDGANQRKRDIQDLEAEKVGTVWTHYMGVSTIVGTAGGLLGIALILLTFWENKRSADAAHDANRPWIEGEKPTDIAMGFSMEEIGFSAEMGVVNHGKSPATNVLAQARLVIISDAEQQTKSALTVGRSGIEAALDEWEKLHPQRGKTVYPGKSDKIIVVDKLSVAAVRRAQGEPPEKIHYLLAVAVSYRFRRKRGRTVTAYLLTIKNNQQLFKVPYDVGKGETHVIDANISLTDTHEGYAR